MSSTLSHLISRHKKMIEQGEISTDKILHLASLSLLDQLCHESENRDRLFHVLGHIQQRIDEEIDRDLSQDEIHNLKEWARDYQEAIARIHEKDEKIVELLEQDKNKTTQEIAKVYKSKQSIKGYNLNDVR